MPTQKTVPLSAPVQDYEWTLIWASLRYFCGAQTIASATFPAMIIKHFYHRLSPDQRRSLAIEVEDCFRRHGSIAHPQIDQPTWRKFTTAMDSRQHFEVKLMNGQAVKAFRANGKIYPLEKYLQEPYQEIYIPETSIANE
ncbi:MAG: hypothetical protein HY231_23600 [Acidobacteria bacterium]|nr:hypothetical protein [Acidobacteriota bacterium]